MDKKLKILILGIFEENHIGFYFLNAAKQLCREVSVLDAREAHNGGWLQKKIYWHAFDHRPVRLAAMGKALAAECERIRPDVLLCTGIAPLEARYIDQARKAGAKVINYLTDDPWSPAHKSRWFMETLGCYDAIYTTRTANMNDLKRAGAKAVHYLPFAYAPELHFPQDGQAEDRYKCDVLFYGGADADRIPYVRRLVRAGFSVHLYGGYWERERDLRGFWKGFADAATLRRAVKGAAVTLCLVRRQNRDQSCMRTFEAAAMKACMAAEDTNEHRALFGSPGEAAEYFTDQESLCRVIRNLLENPDKRQVMAENAFNIIRSGAHRYIDRLKTMIEPEAGKQG